jgi:hypothetical protein
MREREKHSKEGSVSVNMHTAIVDHGPSHPTLQSIALQPRASQPLDWGRLSRQDRTGIAFSKGVEQRRALTHLDLRHEVFNGTVVLVAA